MPLAIMLDIGEVGPMGPDLWRLHQHRLPEPEALRRSLFEEIEAADDVFLLTGELIPAFGPAGLRKLRDLLASTGAEVRVLAYVREPRAWFKSHVQQLIKTGRTLEEAVGAAGAVFLGASPLAETFGARLSVRLYRPYPTPDGLFGDFLEALDRDPVLAGELDVRWDNTGLSHRAIVLWEAMNRLVRAEGLPALNWVTTARYLGASMPGPAFRLPAATLEAGVSEQADAVALASKQVGIDLTALPAPAEGGADLDWRPAEDHARTVHALLVDLAQAQAEGQAPHPACGRGLGGGYAR